MLIKLKGTVKEFSGRCVPDCDENTVGRDFSRIAGRRIANRHGVGTRLIIAVNTLHHGVHPEINLRVLFRPVNQNARGSECVTPMDYRHRRTETAQEVSLGQRTVTAADHDNGLAAEEESVAGGTVRNTAAGVFGFARHPEFANLRAGGHDYSTGGIRIPAVQHNMLGIALHICADHVVIDDFGAETLSLLAHGIHEIRAHDAVREPGEVLHFSGIDQLSAGRERPGNDHRMIPGAAQINGRSVAGRPGTDDDHVCCLFAHGS